MVKVGEQGIFLSDDTAKKISPYILSQLKKTPENGALEYDGTNLYFTVGGVRKTVTLV